jgi:zinc protease
VDAVWAGGGFGNRLNLNLREDKGYSYGVFSTLALLRDGGFWYASGGVQSDKTKESVVEFDKEMRALVGAKPITAAELATAKSRRVRGYAQQFESLGRIASQVAELWVRQVPMTELQREYDATHGVTLEQALATVKKYVNPQFAGLLLVGDRARIEAGLTELKLREIVVLDLEGNPAGGGQSSGSAR